MRANRSRDRSDRETGAGNHAGVGLDHPTVVPTNYEPETREERD